MTPAGPGGRSRAKAAVPRRTDSRAGNASAFDARSIDPRLARVRGLAWLLDRSIPIGGGMRVGLDPILGLLPGGGDAAGVLLSLYVVFEGARLGLPTRVLARMVGNVALEGIVGTVPLLGDLFDAAWKANVRNVHLIEQFYQPERPSRPLGAIALTLGLVALLLVTLVVALAIAVVALLWRWIG